MAEETTQESSGKPSKVGIYPVCNGAECMCDQSKEKLPALLKVISHKHVYINDKDSTEKLIATTNDLPLPFEKQANTFGTCLKQPLGFGQYKACIPNITKWDKSYKAIKIAQAGNGEALLEESEGTCSFTGKITFTTHGQTQVVTTADAAETPSEITAMLTDGILTEEEVETLANGTFEDNKTKEIEDINVKEPSALTPKGGKKGTYRINQKLATLIFQVNKPTDLTDQDKAAINWAVYIKNKNGTYKHHHTFIDQGNTLTFPYRTVGTYAIEAYGDTKKFDTTTGKGGASNFLDIVYQQISGLELFVGAENRTPISRVRPTEPITISAKKEFKDNGDINSKHIIWEVTSGGKIIDFERVKGTMQITVKPQLNTTTKTVAVKATYEGVTKSITFKVGKNYVKSITANKETIAVLENENDTPKERQKVTFSVADTDFVMPYDSVKDANVIVKWCVYDEKTRSAKRQLASTTDKSKVPASIKALAAKHYDPTTSKGYHKIEGHTYTGSSLKEGTWYAEAYGFSPTGSDATSKPFVVVKPKITKAFWADKNGNSISKSGYGHQVYIHIETEGLLGEKLQLKVWESQKGNDTYIENAGTDIEIKQANGIVNQAFTIPDDKKAGYKENYKYEFFLTIERLDFAVQNTKKDEQADSQYILIPKGKPHYLNVDSKQQITSLKIYETGNKLHTGIVKYGDTVTIKINTRNLCIILI